MAILAADGFEQVELTSPRDAVAAAGGETVLITLDGKSISANQHRDHGDTFTADLSVSSANPDDYDALLIPGGLFSPDALRTNEAALSFVEAFFEQKKPVFSICHGPQVLISADAIRAADGLVISSPEYNYGPPGVLKNAIDWLSRVEDQPFEDLPISLMSASPSPMGGIRAQYPLRQIFVALKADVTPRPEVAVASAYERFDDGKLVHEQTRSVIANHLSAFGAVLKRHA